VLLDWPILALLTGPTLVILLMVYLGVTRGHLPPFDSGPRYSLRKPFIRLSWRY